MMKSYKAIWKNSRAVFNSKKIKILAAFLYSGVRIVIADEKNEYMKYIYNDINNCLLNMSKGGRKINVRMFEIEGIAPLWVENQELISAIKFIPRL
uniref:Uncharacterized protein n=1 Tax=Strongyloides stercoralis TaxID=6248 RepID=A0A0K0EBY8_STRER